MQRASRSTAKSLAADQRLEQDNEPIEAEPRIYAPIREVPWHKDAACYRQGDELFFHDGRAGAKPAEDAAKQVCNDPCPVKAECMRASLEKRERYGVWGGLTPRERKNIFKQIDLGNTTVDEVVGLLCD